jgi:hypothetical protein
MRTVGKKGIFFDGGRYYAKEVIQCLGQRVQIRVPLDSDDLFYVFSLEGKKLFDAVYQDDSGTVAEQVVNGESLPADNTPEKKPVNNKLIKLFIK